MRDRINRQKNRMRYAGAAGMLGLLLCGCNTGGAAVSQEPAVTPVSEAPMEITIKTGNSMNKISCHDPQVLYADGTYYMVGSHQVQARSQDLKEWQYNGNKMFSNIYSGDLPAFAYVGKNDQGDYSVWASNLYYNATMGKYLMYFCTSSTYIKSTLALAVSDTPEGPYTFTDTLLYSGFETSTVDQTDLAEVLGEDADLSRYFKYGGYDNKKWPNCIDPAIIEDTDGKQWMVYGSWSGGLFLLEIDPATGLPIHPEADEANGVDPYFGYHLIGGGHHACEGPYLTYSEETGYYYLFASFGGLNREDGYQIRQFRSESITGPYLDAAGQLMGDQENFTSYGLKMMGNYKLPSLETAYMAPGGQSVFTGADGDTYLVYHQRFDQGTEYHEPRVHKIFLNRDGWYVAAPFAYQGEKLSESGYDTAAIGGTFYVLDHEQDVGNLIHTAEECTFENGVIRGAYEGSYEVTEGSCDIRITLGGKEYCGVIVEMTDEAGNDTLCITAAGADNRSIWAVQYR